MFADRRNASKENINVVREAQCWREAIFFLGKRESSESKTESIGVVRTR